MKISAQYSSDPADFESAPARLSINLSNLVDNWRAMGRLSGKARAAAVVKADGYGLGIEPVGAALYAAGARDFFVAEPMEGASLREVAPEARIYVLTGVWPGQQETVIGNDLVPILASEEQLAFWMTLVADGLDHPCALNIDTGMNRLGLSPDEALHLADDPSRPSAFEPVLIMSHLACADEPGHAMNRRQLQTFQHLRQAYEGIESSLCNSAAIHLGADYHFDLTRPGIALYGGHAGHTAAKPALSVATAEARILQIRDAKQGQTVSYGATHTLERDSRLAIVAAGYADGLHRALSGSGVAVRNSVPSGAYGHIAGYKVPLVGRITMDLTIFDVTDIPENRIRAGDYIELFGANISVDEAARAAGTIGYELLTSLGRRYERQYLG